MAKITLLMSVVSLVRFSIDVFSLPMTQLINNIIKTYKVVFHTCFDLIFAWVPFSIPDAAKDLLIFYFLFGFIYQKIIFNKLYFDYKHPWIILHNYNNSKIKYFAKSFLLAIKAVFLWPIELPTLLHKPYLIVFYGAHGPSALSFTHQKPDLTSFRGMYYGDGRIMMLFRLASILLGAAGILVLNYAFSI